MPVSNFYRADTASSIQPVVVTSPVTNVQCVDAESLSLNPRDTTGGMPPAVQGM